VIWCGAATHHDVPKKYIHIKRSLSLYTYRKHKKAGHLPAEKQAEAHAGRFARWVLETATENKNSIHRADRQLQNTLAARPCWTASPADSRPPAWSRANAEAQCL
jgi:hypothetical protein